MIKYKNCRICNSNNIETVIKFEKTPIGDAWKKVKKIHNLLSFKYFFL